MNENDLRIAKFTNISDFDFNGDLGARYGGKDYFFAAGESKMVPYFAADHFATHLARAIIIKGAPIRTEAEMGGKGLNIPLWSESKINELKAKMLTEVYSEEKEAKIGRAHV